MIDSYAQWMHLKTMFNEEPRPPNKTNLEIVTDFMEWGSHLNQAFVVEALGRYAKEIRANREEVIRKMKDSPIHPESWVKCADDWAAIDKIHYGGNV